MYRVTIEFEAPTDSYDTPRVAAAIGMALGGADILEDLVITRLDVEHDDA